jgi:response regulator RpfG family c-di-GMP phosphodiesterase
LLARVLAVAEKFEALTAGRGCTRVTPQLALDQIAAASGSEFDPAAVEALGRAVRDGTFDVILPEVAFPATVRAPVPA